jgi:quercetin dioxygenase-like cupin family protein
MVLTAVLTVILGVGVLTQVTIKPAPAQMMGPPKMTGKIVEKTIAEFKDLNLPGIKNVKYVNFSAAPNAKVENLEFDHVELCNTKRGTVVVTLANGQKVTHKTGDVFIIPMGLKAKTIAFGPGGYEENHWLIFPAK